MFDTKETRLCNILGLATYNQYFICNTYEYFLSVLHPLPLYVPYQKDLKKALACLNFRLHIVFWQSYHLTRWYSLADACYGLFYSVFQSLRNTMELFFIIIFFSFFLNRKWSAWCKPRIKSLLTLQERFFKVEAEKMQSLSPALLFLQGD